MFKLVIALIGTMLANIFLGASLAKVKEEFDKNTLTNGIFKAGCIVIGFLFMIGAAALTEDIVVASVNGADMNLLEGMRAVVIAGIIVYSGKDLIKLANLFNLKTKIEMKESDDNE